MKGLAALRTYVALLCLPLAAMVACSGGGSSSPAASVPSIGAPGQLTVLRAVPRAASRSGMRRAATPGCTPFPYSAPMLPPPCTIYVGGYISPQHDQSVPQQIASTKQFEKTIGRKLAMHTHYYLWTDGFPGIADNDDKSNGRIPFESWHCGDTDYNVVNGVWDQMLTKRALAIKAFGWPMFIRYKWEMNLVLSPNCADPANDLYVNGREFYSPTYFKAAWDHIRAIFAANGVTNVVWVFNASGSGEDPMSWYPGDDEVDWVGFDHYDTDHIANFTSEFSEVRTSPSPGNTNSPKPLYLYTSTTTEFPTKPIVIGETGIEGPQQQAFLDGANGANVGLPTAFPNIQAFLYWDSTGVRGQYQLQQFGIPAFASLAAGAYEQGMYKP
ncbi:MAG: hypothetical protein IAI50_19480 [Candidatus Eremiobacteraeota bacterium]|nr:hypothetical protein [Candidatus Eremiobacteraeota bacterium]